MMENDGFPRIIMHASIFYRTTGNVQQKKIYFPYW